jgi:hypothetical protein
MALLVCLLALAGSLLGVTVKDSTKLRTGCDPESGVIAWLEPGANVEVKFAIAGESCLKVKAELAGKPAEGYVDQNSLSGLDQFESQRKNAGWTDVSQVMKAVANAPVRNSAAPASAAADSKGLEIVGRGSERVSEAAKLIENSQPSRALSLLEEELKGHRRDPGVLAMAGIAAWRSDDVRRALDYWRNSLEIQPNPDLERLYRRLERESKADQSSDRMVGMRVLLRYEGQIVPPDTARLMIGMLDEEYSRIAGQLGCSTDERVVAIVQSAEAYRKSTDAAEWSGGQFDGRIRVPLIGSSIPVDQLRRTFAHEIVHACLATMGTWPAWFHEGMAQRLSGDRTNPGVRQQIAGLAKQHQVPKLTSLGQDWSRMSGRNAALAYAMSLAAIELFDENWSSYGVRNLLNNPGQLDRIAQDLEKRLGFNVAQ